jgi:hypothetical protein
MSSLFPKRTCRTVLLSILLILLCSEWAPAQQGTPGSWCVLRRHNVYEPSNCFEFFLCDTIRDVQRCGLAGGGGCGVGQLGLREGWLVDPNAHPQETPGPFTTWEGADQMMTALQRMGGNFYACNGPRTMQLPRRVPVSDGPSQPGFCVLRKPIVGWPANCFEFYLALAGGGRAVIQGAACMVTSLAARENWQVDPNQGGPYIKQGDAQAAHNRLNPYGGNFYGCPPGTPGGLNTFQPAGPPVRDGLSEQGFCVLRKPIPSWPPNCFEFYLAVAGGGRAVIQGGTCFVTSLAARENWIIDPTMGGPHLQRAQAQAAHDRLHRFAGNFYGCQKSEDSRIISGGGTPVPVRRTVTGGLDAEEVRKRVDGRRVEGASVQFESGTVTLEINPDGAAGISGNLTFTGQFRRPPNAPPDIRRHTFVLYAGKCNRDGSSCTGKGSRAVDHVYPTGRRSWPPGEIDWRASRQADGSYTFWVPNGEAPLWSEVTYRLR